jgi:hypothetical protein
MSACSGAGTRVELHAFLAEGEPIVGMEILSLPFDPDRITDSLTRTANKPRPTFPELRAEMAAYRRPGAARLHEIGTSWRATRDSVKHLADSLNQVSPDAPGYAAAYERLRQKYRRLAQRQAERDVAFREQMGDDRDLALRASDAADSLRQWESEAYADFPALADSALACSGREPQEGVTDAAGRLTLVLEPGPWWLIARMRDEENPFSERYWNVAVVMSNLGPLRIPLSESNSLRRWRH